MENGEKLKGETVQLHYHKRRFRSFRTSSKRRFLADKVYQVASATWVYLILI